MISVVKIMIFKFKLIKIIVSIVINVNRISMGFRRLVASRVIAITAARRVSNVTRMDNVRVMTMLKDGVVIDARRINMIVIKDVWTVHIAII